MDELERVAVASAAVLRDWLAAHHTQDESVWLVTWRKHVAGKYVSTEETLDELLAFGWIDGVRRKLDTDRTMQLIGPRKAQHWAKSYKDRVARLTKEGRMHPAGLASVERAKTSGLWSFMDDVDALVRPPDLAEALDERPAAKAYFDTCPDAYVRNILRWIKLAKSPETRATRIGKTVDASAIGERLPQM